jgi:hypothetical protein
MYRAETQSRNTAPAQRIENWSLTSLEQCMLKTGGRLVKHARYYLVIPGGRKSESAAVRGDAKCEVIARLQQGSR